MTGVYRWGWGNGGRDVVFWGWAQSYAGATEEPWIFVPSVVIEDVLTAAQVIRQGVSVSVTDRFVAGAAAGAIRSKTVPEGVTVKSVVLEKSVKSANWAGSYVSGLNAPVRRSVIGGFFASKVEAAGTVGKSCSQNEKRKIVKK